MSENKQAYTGFANLPAQSSEWNQMDFMIRSVMNQMATTTLVQVKTVNETADGFTVDVQPMVSQVDGAGNAVAHGVIHAMPVWRVQGGVSALIVAPAVGDIGVAIFASTDISGVKRSKGATTPGSARRFDWADGIYLGGLYGAPVQTIKMDDMGITITSGAGLPVTINAPGGLVIAADVTITGDLTNNGKDVGSAHTHSGVTTGGGNSGPPV